MSGFRKALFAIALLAFVACGDGNDAGTGASGGGSGAAGHAGASGASSSAGGHAGSMGGSSVGGAAGSAGSSGAGGAADAGDAGATDSRADASEDVGSEMAPLDAPGDRSDTAVDGPSEADAGGVDQSADAGSDADASGADATGSDADGATAPSNPRVDVIVDTGWKFNRADVSGAEAPAFNDGAWTTVNLPHTWNNLDGENGPTTTPSYYRGIGWYRRHFTIPADTMSGKRLYVQFDGSAYVTNVWVNGTSVGSHAGGYAGFRFDITAAANVGADNVIAVKVDNSAAVTSTFNVIPGSPTANVPPRSGDFTFFGGIYRDVHLLATDPLAISPLDFGSSGVYLTQTNVNTASAHLTVMVKMLNGNAAPKTAAIDVDIVDASGAVVKTLSGGQTIPANSAADVFATGIITNPHLWDGLADPYLYRARVTVRDVLRVTDIVEQPLGLRSFAFDPNTGFSLNGRPYPLHGVCMHQDHKDEGPSFSARDIDDDYALIREMGANSIRFVHYQHAQYTYDKADRLGIVGWAENALVDSINDTPEFLANAKQQLVELIRQSYNHPSIVTWGLSSDLLLRPSTPASANILATVTALNTLAHQEDPTRTTINESANNLQDDPVNFAADMSGFDTYNGWYYRRVADFAAWADAKHAMYPTKLIAVGEYGAGASIVQHALPIVETGTDRTAGIQAEEYAAFFHEAHWTMISVRPFLVWTNVASMFDFASDFRNEGLMPGLNTKGLVTYDRQVKKDPFYWYKANWSTEPFVYITSRRYAPMPTASTEIKVYSNQPEVEITLNGTSLGAKQAPGHLFLWTGVTWAPGANVVRASVTTMTGVTDQVTWLNN
jgi:beta-galactosidase